MPADYKLRLGDGTILAVDEAGLRTWLIDGKAMVQPAGSRRWMPLREVLAQVQAQAAAEARRAASTPRPEPTPPAPAPAPPPPVTPPAAAPAPAPAPAEFALPEPEPFFVPSAPPPAAAAAAPVAKPPVPPAPVVKAPPVAAAPPAPKVATRTTPPAPKPPAPAPSAPPPRPIAVAAAKPAERASSAKPLDLAEVARTAFVAPIAETTSDSAPPSSAELPVIPFKALDEAALLERAKATMDQGEEEDSLEELPLVDPAEDPLTKATRKGQELFATAAARVRQMVASARPQPPLPPAGEPFAATASRERIASPTPLSEVPALRFADEKAPRRGPKPGMKANLLIAGGVAAILVIATGWAWVPSLIQAARRMVAGTEKKPGVPSPLAGSPTPPPPTLPPDVQAAVDQLPHLTPETIQVVMKKSAYRPRDPAEVFSRAETAAVRGMSSLSEEEAKELSALRLAVATSLRPTDRQRVRGYERIRTGRELLSVSEDVKVLALFARGVRALPPEKRARLQTLLGKAIVAQLGPLPSPDGTYSAATPGR